MKKLELKNPIREEIKNNLVEAVSTKEQNPYHGYNVSNDDVKNIKVGQIYKGLLSGEKVSIIYVDKDSVKYKYKDGTIEKSNKEDFLTYSKLIK